MAANWIAVVALDGILGRFATRDEGRRATPLTDL
jgi:hypothetical protein